ncbi:MAG: hypothetical protein PHP99_04460 [Paludibacter sp.]|nr:hypothetical protein [Paludibacter sp.]
MEIGELFRISKGSKAQKEMIFKAVEVRSDIRTCNKCAAKLNKKLCIEMPDCLNIHEDFSYVFVKLTSNEAKRAIKQKLTIKQY